jgi:hypothetical protein
MGITLKKICDRARTLVLTGMLVPAALGFSEQNIIIENVSRIEFAQETNISRPDLKDIIGGQGEASVSIHSGFYTNLPTGFSFDTLNYTVEKNHLSWKLGEKDFTFSYDGVISHDVMNYFNDFDFDFATKDWAKSEAERILDGESVANTRINGMTLREICVLVKDVHELSKIEVGKNSWKYNIDLEARGRVYSNIISKQDFVNSDELPMEFVNGYFSSVEGSGNAYFDLNVKWNKDRSLECIVDGGKIFDIPTFDIGVDSRIGYSNFLEKRSGFFMNLRTKNDSGWDDYGIISTDTERETNFEEICAESNLDMNNLDAEFSLGRKKYERNETLEENVLYYGKCIENNNTFANFGFGSVFTNRKNKGKFVERKETFSLNSVHGGEHIDIHKEEDEEDGSNLVRGLYAASFGKEFSSGKYFDFGGFVSGKNYVNDFFIGGVSLRNKLVSAKVDSDGNYFVAYDIFNEGENDFGEYFNRDIINRSSFVSEYLSENIPWTKKSGLFGFATRDLNIEKLGLAACFDGENYFDFGVIKDGAMNGYFAEVRGRNFNFEGSCLIDETDGEEKRYDVCTGFKLDKNIALVISGIVGREKAAAFVLKYTN